MSRRSTRPTFIWGYGEKEAAFQPRAAGGGGGGVAGRPRYFIPSEVRDEVGAPPPFDRGWWWCRTG